MSNRITTPFADRLTLNDWAPRAAPRRRWQTEALRLLSSLAPAPAAFALTAHLRRDMGLQGAVATAMPACTDFGTRCSGG